MTLQQALGDSSAAAARPPLGAPDEEPPQQRATAAAAAAAAVSLYTPAELEKLKHYDEELFAALEVSRCCCWSAPIASFAAKYAAQQSDLTTKRVEKYLQRRTHIYRHVDDLLLGLGGLLDPEEAAAAAASGAAAAATAEAASADGASPDSPGKAEDGEHHPQQPHAATNSSSNSNSSRSSSESQRRALKWTTKKLRWICDDELQRHPLLLEGPVALKCCVFGEAIEAAVRQGLVSCLFETLSSEGLALVSFISCGCYCFSV